METDRLRRLDALFAERVLGNTEEHASFTSSCHVCGGDSSHLPRYTRSLDAAWEGAKQRGLAFGIETVGEDWSCRACIGARHSYVMEMPQYEATAPHPAEALVLACLRAVGVSEEEIGDAE